MEEGDWRHIRMHRQSSAGPWQSLLFHIGRAPGPGRAADLSRREMRLSSASPSRHDEQHLAVKHPLLPFSPLPSWCLSISLFFVRDAAQ